MSTKKKLIVSITILCLTVVTAIVSVIGVFALLNTDFTFGGSISFTATSVNATVSQATITEGALQDTTKLQEIKFDANQEGYDLEGAINSWSGLSLNFNEDGDDVIIKFTVTNHSETDILRLDIGELTGAATNATMTATLTIGRSGVTVAESTAVINPAVQAGGETPKTEHSAEVVIRFHIIDKNKDASITDFSIPISLKKFDGYNVTFKFDESFMFINSKGDTTDATSAEMQISVTLIGSEEIDLGGGYPASYTGKAISLSVNPLNPYRYTIEVNGTDVEFDYFRAFDLTEDTVFSVKQIESLGGFE